MAHVWPIQNPFILRELGMNRFQFVFSSKEDKEKVFRNRTWIFDNQFLTLKEWKEGADRGDLEFNHIDVWVQIWDLPLSWISTDTGIRIGKIFPSMSDIYIPDSGSIKGRHIKLLVSIDVNKPLLRGVAIKLGEASHWVNFKYEKMAGFCFYCGFIGHFDRICDKKKKDIGENSFREGQYGDWLKAVDLLSLSKSSRPPSFSGMNTPASQSYVQSVPVVKCDLKLQATAAPVEISKDNGKLCVEIENPRVITCERGETSKLIDVVGPVNVEPNKELSEVCKTTDKVEEGDNKIPHLLEGDGEAIPMDLSNLVEIKVLKNFVRTPLKEIGKGSNSQAIKVQSKPLIGKVSKIRNASCQMRRGLSSIKEKEVTVNVGGKRSRNKMDENNCGNGLGDFSEWN
ncbi:hypothetical protein DH2020_001929 [Rehmannia glutinosa]|uniref:CCHC-type domain-containing protein n=1 Tax=Rehmannia glutinosa TaxID=99300 RepID=A0ABR0XSP7_REHGL